MFSFIQAIIVWTALGWICFDVLDVEEFSCSSPMVHFRLLPQDGVDEEFDVTDSLAAILDGDWT